MYGGASRCGGCCAPAAGRSSTSRRFRGSPLSPATTSTRRPRRHCSSRRRAVAVDYGPFGIRCNAVLPGVIETPMTYASLPPELESGGGASDRRASLRRCSASASRRRWPRSSRSSCRSRVVRERRGDRRRRRGDGAMLRVSTPRHRRSNVSTRLQGRRALVTGASSGIGREVALRFAAEGAAVACGGRDAERTSAHRRRIARCRRYGGRRRRRRLGRRGGRAVVAGGGRGARRARHRRQQRGHRRHRVEARRRVGRGGVRPADPHATCVGRSSSRSTRSPTCSRPAAARSST